MSCGWLEAGQQGSCGGGREQWLCEPSRGLDVPRREHVVIDEVAELELNREVKMRGSDSVRWCPGRA